MRFLIAIVSSVLLAGVALLVMVGPSGVTGLFSSNKTTTTKNIQPIAQSDVVATPTPPQNKLPKFLPKATTTAEVVQHTAKQASAKVSTTTASATIQPSIVTSEETAQVYFQKAVAQYSALVSAELKKESSYPPNSTGASVTAALHTMDGQLTTALTFSVLKIEEYKALKGAYPPDFTLKISMPLINTEYAFTKSADGKTFTLCQSTCIDSKDGFEYGPYASVLVGLENIQSLFDKKWIAQALLQGRDEIIMSSLKSIGGEAVQAYTANNSFVGLCGSTYLNNARQASLAPEKVICSDSTSAAAAEAYLPYKGAYFCVDTTGYNGELVKSKGVGALACAQ